MVEKIKLKKKKVAKEKKQVLEMSKSELEKLIVELANQGYSSAEIGTILKEQHNILSVKAVLGKRILEVLEEKGIKSEVPEDLMNLIRKFVALQKHLEQHKKDTKAKRGYQLTISKIRRLVKYYVRTGKLPEKWVFTPEKAQLLVK